MLDAGSANVFDAMLRVGSLRNNSDTSGLAIFKTALNVVRNAKVILDI
jgi:hypothetical protein